MQIFLIAPLKSEYTDIVSTVREAVLMSNEKNVLVTPEQLYVKNVPSNDDFENHITLADLIIADISDENSFNLFEVGIAKAKNKPILFIAQKNSFLPYFISTNYLIQYYDRSRLKETLLTPLIYQLSKLNAYQSLTANLKLEKEDTRTVFISYSREDKEYLRRLLVHIRPFERNGNVDIWADDKIKAGEKWKKVIEKALEKAAIAILLISADFLASEFIIDNELPPLLKSAEEKGTVILPLVLKPCLLKAHMILSEFQALNDPKLPLSKLCENDKEEIFVKTAEYIYNLIKK